MKNKILILFAGVFSLTILSCYDDKGSYDYHDINEITVSNWPSGGYTYLDRDTLRITPQVGVFDSTSTEPYIGMTLDDGNPDRYEYVWEISRSTIAGGEDYKAIIGKNRDLVYPIDVEPGTYYLYFKIRDTETDINWLSSSSLIVQSSTDVGFLVLGEKEDGSVGLDMISFAAGDTVILKGLLEDYDLPVLYGPKRVMYTGNYQSCWHVWVSSESGSYYMDPNTMETSSANTFDVFSVATIDLPETIVLEDMSAKRNFGTSPATGNRVMVTEDYVFAVSSPASGEFYGNPLNCYDATALEYFKPFPYVFVGNRLSQNRYLIFDEDNHRFVYFSSGLAQVVTQFAADKDTDPFPWQQPEGRELIYGENSNSMSGTSTYSFALLEDAENCYVYQFLMGSSSSKTAGYTFAKSDAPNIENATIFAFASSRMLLLYADGSVLRGYDFANKRAFEKDLGDEITCMEFDWLGNLDEIMIATYNDTEGGILQRYQLGSDLTQMELTPLTGERWTRQTGLVKVKDIEYKF